jgi:hypothetical protein
MVQHLYPNFLTDAHEYKLAQKFWNDLWKDLTKEVGVAKDWKSPWLAAPLPDGDPIFSAISQAQRRGVHVIQHAPTSDEVEIVSWQDRFGDDDEDEAIDQLVISCALSQESAARARALIRAWVRGEVIEASSPIIG